eukprot:jgi/Ulvmu1/3179/UM015_0220.1
MGYTFFAQPRTDDWDELVDLPNPSHISPQHLKGISEEMSPSALNRDATLVEKKIGTAIKTFQRTISDEVGNAGPEHCRTKNALVLSMRTVQGFLRDPPPALSTVDLRCFTQDRFRAVRQELEQQHIRSRLAVRMLEDMVRYSVMTVHEMCQDSDYSAPLGIDKNEISKMLKSLQQMYQEHRQAGDPIGTEAEFSSYVILLKAGQDLAGSVAMSLAAALMDMPNDIAANPCVKWSLEISRNARERNPARFLHLCEDATYVQACFVHWQFIEMVRQSQVAMLFQRKNSISVPELRDHLLLDTDEEVFRWLHAYNLQFSDDDGKLLLDKVPPLMGRGPGAGVSQQFLRKALGQSLGEMASARLTWPGLHDTAGVQPGPVQAFGTGGVHDSFKKRSLRVDSGPANDFLKCPHVPATRAALPVVTTATQHPQSGVSQAPSLTRTALSSDGQQADQTMPVEQVAIHEVDEEAAHRLASQRAEALQARATEAAAQAAAQAAAAAAVEVEAAQRVRRKQEVEALAAKQAAQKRAEAEAIRTAERIRQIQLDTEYVRAGEAVTRRDTEAWAQAEAQHRLKLAEATRLRADMERQQRQQVEAAAEEVAQKQRKAQAAQYQGVIEAHAALTPQAELSCMEARRQREEYHTMQGCVLQTLLHMKAMTHSPGKALPLAIEVPGVEAAPVAGGNPVPEDVSRGAVATGSAPQVTGPMVAMEVDDARVVDGNYPPAAPAWHESRTVLTAKICARPQNSIGSAPAAFINKLLGPRRFKSAKGRARR